jgi:hypothetical protein
VTVGVGVDVDVESVSVGVADALVPAEEVLVPVEEASGVGVGVALVFSGLALDDSVLPPVDDADELAPLLDVEPVLDACGVELGPELDACDAELELDGCGVGLVLGVGVGVGLADGCGVGLGLDVRELGAAEGDRLGVGGAEDFGFSGSAPVLVPVVPSGSLCVVRELASAVVGGVVAQSVVSARRTFRCAPDTAAEPAVATAITTRRPRAAVWARPKISCARSLPAHRGPRRACLACLLGPSITGCLFPPVPIRHLTPRRTLPLWD